MHSPPQTLVGAALAANTGDLVLDAYLLRRICLFSSYAMICFGIWTAVAVANQQTYLFVGAGKRDYAGRGQDEREPRNDIGRDHCEA